jgi:hypothetical protein
MVISINRIVRLKLDYLWSRIGAKKASKMVFFTPSIIVAIVDK